MKLKKITVENKNKFAIEITFIPFTVILENDRKIFGTIYESPLSKKQEILILNETICDLTDEDLNKLKEAVLKEYHNLLATTEQRQEENTNNPEK
ncbi:hypothetical protein THC_1262 [Caldimicrobium thiodismutans]|uniref:Uncharacterized protein n=1 Tax=Caldimicrobium thiodismutans TaxID=1653476 RepID=A0A0U5AY86_9BACT|nr:hypothetical protein [Caldimicrobium thiodismutans]BAU23630.1 hypothetical protein THC_1262 [Caldimicrobium thiodismutans]